MMRIAPVFATLAPLTVVSATVGSTAGSISGLAAAINDSTQSSSLASAAAAASFTRGLSTHAPLLLTKQTATATRSTLSSSERSLQKALLSTRGGSDEPATAEGQQQYETLASPAPGSPFHYAFPVHDLNLAKDFYGNVLGCVEGRSSEKWQDYSLHGHQIVAHWVGSDYRCKDYYNPVDGDEVPVPHTGLALTVEQFHDLADRLKQAGIEFIIEPHLRFQGMPGEQWTMFFKDPSGNNLEFKAMTKLENLFAKYNVVDK